MFEASDVLMAIDKFLQEKSNSSKHTELTVLPCTNYAPMKNFSAREG